jgi:hypothetical protein
MLLTGGIAAAQAPSGGAPTTGGGVYVTPYADFFDLAVPPSLSATLFGGGFGSDKYGTTQEGFQLEQSLTRYIGLVGRATGYELWVGEGFDNPLDPGTGHRARVNFGRFQGGLDFAPFAATHIVILGGKDVGDSRATDIEGDISTWVLVHSRHPINFAASSSHDFQNGVTSTSIDLQTVAYSGENYMVLAGAGGAFYKGGFIEGSSGQGGPDLGVYFRNWRFGVQLQGGYGSAHQYGQISLYKQFTWLEQ